MNINPEEAELGTEMVPDSHRLTKMVWGDGTWWTASLIWSWMFRDGPKWSEISEMVPFGQWWAGMVKNGPILSEMVTDGPRWDNPSWSDLVQDGARWSSMVQDSLSILWAHRHHSHRSLRDPSGQLKQCTQSILCTLWKHSGYTLSTLWAHSGNVLYWVLRVPYTLRQSQNLIECLVQLRFGSHRIS